MSFVVVLAIAAASTWWFAGGSRLHAGSLLGSVSAQPGQWAHLGIFLNSDGGTVTLERARAINVSGDAQIEFHVIRGEGGFITGSSGGTLDAMGYPTEGVGGVKVHRQTSEYFPKAGDVELVMSLRADDAGSTRVEAVDITYRSGPRTRHVRVEVTMCDGVGATAAERASACE